MNTEFDPNLIFDECKKALDMIHEIDDNIQKYIDRKVCISDADELKDRLISKRDTLYEFVFWYNAEPDLCKDLDAYNCEDMSIHNYLLRAIAACSCAITCLDHYVTECYFNTVNSVFIPFCKTELSYADNFRKLVKQEEKKNNER